MKVEKPSWLLFVVSLLAVLAPMFLMAGTVDSDEFAKSGLGLATVAGVVTVVKTWDWMTGKVK